MRCRLLCLLLFSVLMCPSTDGQAFELRVGAAVIDITPNQLPVLVNGSMTSRSEDQIKTHVNARAIVLDDGGERIGIVIVDSCMLPRQLIDEAKQLAQTRTGLRPDRILIAATHTHTAPSSMGALGTDADPNYVPFLRQKLVEALVAAEAKLAPAKVGWGSGMAPEFTALRRWVRRPDRIAEDPFGNLTVRANMHSARNPDDATGPSGPEDPELSMIAFSSPEGKPIAVLANFSMHYFGDSQISADYFGLFCDGLQQLLRGEDDRLEPVAIMSHGCSGDIWRRDYMQSQPVAEGTINEFSQGLLGVAKRVYESIEYRPNVTISMLETRMNLRYRVPDAQRLEWAERIVAEMGDRLPETQPEIYAREQVYLHQMQSTEIVLQALRIGDIAIATTPTETYALTGLKLKRQSPLEKTMVIELANGGDGYIPPPEQHELGGYNTWAARSAGLEVTAEPKIVAADLRMLEELCDASRRPATLSVGPASQAILELKPLRYWRLNEMSAGMATDSVTGQPNALYESGVVFYLQGPEGVAESGGQEATGYTQADELNRCPHFAGGRLRTQIHPFDGDFSVAFHLWNGMPVDGRDVAGWMFSCDEPNSVTQDGIHLGLGGTASAPGKLILQVGDGNVMTGESDLPRWSWQRVSMVRSGRQLDVFLNGNKQPEISYELPESFELSEHLFFGGRSDNESNWQGRLDEIVVFDHAVRP